MRYRNNILLGDALDVLGIIPSNSIHTCVCSPPYFHARDYGSRRWFGGDHHCEHDRNIEHGPHHPGAAEQTLAKKRETGVVAGHRATTSSCSQCNAWWGQLGLEPTVEKYVEHMVAVFREVRRTLRPDGTFWLNLGDSAAYHTRSGGVPAKNLLGIPWRTALALRDDGWILRAEVIWSKANGTPESVIDRPARSHEQVFLFAKQRTYYYDSLAVREAGENGDGRSLRSVWHLQMTPYAGAHFAVMPESLADRCIRASTSEKGCCSTCGSPTKRVVKRLSLAKALSEAGYVAERLDAERKPRWQDVGFDGPPEPVTVGWTATCKCGSGTKPCLVLDPFAGAGTTLMVARKLGRDFVGVEINEEYADMAARRVCAAPRPVDVGELLLDVDLQKAS